MERMGQYLIDSILEIEIIKKILNFKIRILPINSIFGYSWIICWFIAIWFYPLQFFFMGLFCLILSLTNFKPTLEREEQLSIIFSQDLENKALILEKLIDDNLNWNDIEICSGEAILPEGIIEKGDIIYNCKGNISLRHIPTNAIFGAYYFE